MRHKFIQQTKQQQAKFAFDYFYADKLLRLLTIVWIITRLVQYQTHLIYRKDELFEPLVWIQQLTMQQLPSSYTMYAVVALAILLTVITLLYEQIIARIILFFLLLWLNAVKWNYGYFPSTGNLLLLSHLLLLFLPSTIPQNKKNVTAIQWAYFGIFATYTMAGTWKFLGLLKSFFYSSERVGWLHPNAVEYNTIISRYYHDESLPTTLFQLYQVPYIWEIATFLIFTVQLFAIVAAISRKWGIAIMIGLFSFHCYSWVVNKTEFIVSMTVVVLLLFPYHLVLRKQFKTIK